MIYNADKVRSLRFAIAVWWCAVGFIAAVSTTVVAKPQRIVSLNLCVDQIIIDLVAPERIAALSFLATDQMMSAISERAQSYTRVKGAAEDVLALDPDLIFVGAYSTPATRNLLRRLGKHVVVVNQPATFDGIRDVIRQLAKAVQEDARGEAMIAAFDRRLARALEQRGSQVPTALALQVNSFVSMPGSLLDDAFRVAGLHNVAVQLGQGRGGRVALESLLNQPPDILVLVNAPDDFRTVLADNLRHPAVRHLSARQTHVTLPMWSTLCGTPYVATAVSLLIKARAEFLALRSGK